MTEKEYAKDLLSIGAVFLRPEQPFTWASGIKSPIYCDNRLTLSAPEVRNHIEEGLTALVTEHFPNVEMLMGTSTAYSSCGHCCYPFGYAYGICA